MLAARPARLTASGHVHTVRPALRVLFGLTVASLLIPLACSRGAHAQEAGTGGVELPTIEVKDSAPDAFETPNDVTGFTQVIPTDEAWRGYENVGDVLERAAGVQVRNFGDSEDFQTISIRGSTPNQVKVLLDGVSLSRAQSDVVNLADIPMDSVERIEVYRGFTPVRFASSGAASVVNIITRKDTAGEIGASVTYGSFNTAKISLHGGQMIAGGTATQFLTYRHTDGDFRFRDDTPDPVANPSGKTVTRTRINNDQDSADLTLRWTRPVLGEGALTLTGNGYYKDEGTPGPASNHQPLASYEEGRGIFSAALDTGNGTTVSTDLTILGEIVRDPKDPVHDIPGLGRPPKAENTTVAWGTGASHARALGRYQLLEGSIETAYEGFDGTYSGTAERLPERWQQRARLALAAGDEIDIPFLRIVLSPQLRYESVWNFFDGQALYPPVSNDDLPDGSDESVDPRFGLRFEPIPELTIKGNIGTYFRPPTFGEMFGDDGLTAANPSLSPETGTNRDIGFLVRPPVPSALRDVTIEYAYFDNDVDDMIVYVASGSRIPRPQNVGSARVSGHELRLEGSGPFGTSVSANYTHQDAENHTPFPEFHGKQIPSLPSDEVYARTTLARTHWSLSYEFDYRSTVYLDQANLLDRSPAYTTHSFSLELRPFLAQDLRLALQLHNVTNEQVSDVVGYPVPGRAFYVTLSYAGRLPTEHP